MGGGFNYTLPQLPYREYVALLTQFDTPELVAEVLYNSLGFVPTLEHDSTGTYRIADFNQGFTENKTVNLFGNSEKDELLEYQCSYVNAGNIILKVYSSGSLSDDRLFRFPITIRIYS